MKSMARSAFCFAIFLTSVAGEWRELIFVDEKCSHGEHFMLSTKSSFLINDPCVVY